jgi:AcrR family transcriptional regulator
MTPAASGTSSEVGTRPRVEGDREQEILDATLTVLADVGYDRLTMDAVATAARASKATLYRRWSTKSALVIDALKSQKPAHAPADTGNLRDDLLATYCGMGGQADQAQIAILASVITAIGRDADFAEAFRRDFIGPKAAVSAEIFARARARGEIRDDVDLDVVVPALPGIALHRQFLLGQSPDVDFITRVIDQVILPAVAVGLPATTHLTTDPNEKDHS